MAFHVQFTSKAKKQLAAIEKRQAKLIICWIEKNLEGCMNPRGIEGSKQIKGSQNGWRYRVGSYRILASIIDEDLIIEVVRVGHRQGVYENLPKM